MSGNRRGHYVIDPISWQFAWPYMLSALFGGYALGSVPFGLVLTRLSGLGDIRKIGSGNIGATNVLRTGHKGLAAATMLLDLLKGVVAVLLGKMYGPDIAIIAGLGAILGHIFPVWLGFKGGKGVATALGVILALSWQAGLIVFGIWVMLLIILRISSVAALAAALAAPISAWWLASPQIMEFFILLAAIVWLRHIANIKRLLKGEEGRIGGKSKDS
jgi:glycerol-3-phosphate acyltransferase PlsY